MYTEVPVAQISTTLHKIATSGWKRAPPQRRSYGNVKGFPPAAIACLRTRSWIDVWTTDRIPENPQLRAIVNEFVRGISPATAASMNAIHGMPLYVD